MGVNFIDYPQKVQTDINEEKKEISLLKNKPFLITLLSIIFNSLGMSIYLLTESWYIVSYLGTGNVLGLVLMATAIPRLILMPLGGVLADRFKRTQIMFVSDFTRGLFLIIMLVFFISDMLTFPWLIIFALGFGILDAFYWPAASSLIPTVVSEHNLAQANSIVQIVQQVFFLGGPLIGGVLITFTSYSIVFSVISIIMIMGAFISLYIGKWIPKSQEITEQSISFFEELKEGFKFINSDPFIKIIIITVSLAGFCLSGPLSLAIPLIVDSVLQGTALTLSYLEISVSVGMILGGIIIVITKIKKRRALLSLLSLSLCGIFLLFIGLSKHFFVILLLLSLSGLFLTFSNTFFITLLQERTPTDKLGRVMSLVTTATTGLLPLSQALISISLSGGASISQVLIILGGTISIFCILIIVFSKSVKTV